MRPTPFFRVKKLEIPYTYTKRALFWAVFKIILKEIILLDWFKIWSPSTVVQLRLWCVSGVREKRLFPYNSLQVMVFLENVFIYFRLGCKYGFSLARNSDSSLSTLINLFSSLSGLFNVKHCPRAWLHAAAGLHSNSRWSSPSGYLHVKQATKYKRQEDWFTVKQWAEVTILFRGRKSKLGLTWTPTGE